MAKKFGTPIHLVPTQVVDALVFSVEKELDLALPKMDAMIKAEIIERGKVATKRLINNTFPLVYKDDEGQLNITLETVGNWEDIEYGVPKGTIVPITELMAWIKAKRKYWGSDALGREREEYAKNLAVRKTLWYGDRSKKGYAYTPSKDRDIAELIQYRIKRYGSKGSMYKFVGIHKSVDGNIPRYLKFSRPMFNQLRLNMDQMATDAVKKGLFKDYKGQPYSKDLPIPMAKIREIMEEVSYRLYGIFLDLIENKRGLRQESGGDVQFISGRDDTQPLKITDLQAYMKVSDRNINEFRRKGVELLRSALQLGGITPAKQVNVTGHRELNKLFRDLVKRHTVRERMVYTKVVEVMKEIGVKDGKPVYSNVIDPETGDTLKKMEREVVDIDIFIRKQMTTGKKPISAKEFAKSLEAINKRIVYLINKVNR